MQTSNRSLGIRALPIHNSNRSIKAQIAKNHNSLMLKDELEMKNEISMFEAREFETMKREQLT